MITVRNVIFLSFVMVGRVSARPLYHPSQPYIKKVLKMKIIDIKVKHMANKKVKPTEDYYDFLPPKLQESTKLTISEKNVLAALCYLYQSHSIYAEKHDGWFFTKQQILEKESELEHAQLNRNLLKLILKKAVERKSGTNHKCSHYRLHHKIVELLPKNEGDFELEETANDTLDIDIDVDIDKTRYSLGYISTNNKVVENGKKNNFFPIQQQFSVKEFYNEGVKKLESCKTELQAKETFHELKVEITQHSNDFKTKEGLIYLEHLNDFYDKIVCKLHFKKK